jgi:trans-2,3-dihydro-3-hydroxyanthranilate isomerase
MIFAGHPTIGSAFVALTEKLVARERPEFVLQEEVGPVRVRTEGDEPLIWLTTPPVSRKGALERGACARAVGLSENDLLGDVPCEIWTAGNPNLYLAVRDKEAVDRASADTAALRELYASQPEPVCTYVFAKAGDGTYSRMFAPQLGVPEDPATGSAAGPLAAFMMAHGLCPHAGGTQFINEQGTKMGRRSLLHVRINGERGADGIEVGGYVSPIVRATMTL